MATAQRLDDSNPIGVEDAATDDGSQAEIGDIATTNPPRERKIKPGRPRTVNRRLLAKKVFALMANGTLTKVACLKTGVKYRTLMDWVRTDPTLEALWTTARHQQAHALAEQAVRVAQTTLKSPENTAKVQAARLHLDAIRWYVARTNPDAYGVHRELDTQIRTLRVVYDAPNPMSHKALRGSVEVGSQVEDAEFTVLPAPAIPLQSVPPVPPTGEIAGDYGADDGDLHHQTL